MGQSAVGTEKRAGQKLRFLFSGENRDESSSVFTERFRRQTRPEHAVAKESFGSLLIKQRLRFAEEDGQFLLT